MDRRFALGLGLMSTAAASSLIVSRAEAQSSCVTTCYPQIPAEQGMTLDSAALMYPPGNLRRYYNGEANWNNALINLRNVAAHGIACHIPAGVYEYSDSPNWAISGLQLTGERGTVLKHTGSGVALNIDAGPNGARVDGLVVAMLVIEGNTATTDALFSQGVTHSLFRMIEVRGCSGKAFHIRFGVLNHYDTCIISGDIASLTAQPAAGFYLDSSGTGYYTSTCTFTNCSAESFSGKGCALVDARNNLFHGGSFESTGIGVDIIEGISLGKRCQGNRFVNVWFEDNATTDLRVQAGTQNSFSGCYFGSTSALTNVLISEASATTFEGGYIRRAELQNAATHTVFLATTFDGNFTQPIIGPGSYRLFGGTKCNNSLDITGTLPNVL